MAEPRHPNHSEDQFMNGIIKGNIWIILRVPFSPFNATYCDLRHSIEKRSSLVQTVKIEEKSEASPWSVLNLHTPWHSTLLAGH